MSSTLLQLVDRAANELSLAAPASVISNTNQEVVQLLALINAVGYELLGDYDWQTLVREHRENLVTFSYTGDTTADSTSVTNMSSITGLSARFMVTGTGIESDTYDRGHIRPCGHRILSPVRLPIPPLPLEVDSTICCLR